MTLLNASGKRRFALRSSSVVAACMISVWGAAAQEAEPVPTQEQLAEAVEQAKRYCEAVADQSKDARIAWQMRALFDVERQMKVKVEELDAKIAELRSWVKKRDDILTKAEGHVVDIYASMRPDAAALQLNSLDDETAVSILLQMKARKASAVLAELAAERAAYLTDLMAELTARKSNSEQLGASQ